MQAALLPDRAIVKVSGDDARRFLHGLLTADIETMTAAEPRYAALLTPQGKIVADCLVVQIDEPAGVSFLLDCERAAAAALIAKLNLYKLRMKVTIADAGETAGAIALWDAAGQRVASAAGPLAPPPGHPWFADPRFAGLGFRAIAAPETAAALARAQGAALVDPAAYEAHRIALAIPRGGRDFLYGDAFPHEADMDQLNGLDFAKGCYVGQEVVSRMRHRATVRNRVLPVRIEGTAPDVGAAIMAGEKPVGTMGSAADGRGLAVLRLDRVAEAEAARQPLRSGAASLHPIQPAWAGFAWPPAKAPE